MKKIIIPILTIIIFLTTLTNNVYAANADTWVQNAFDATDKFIHETPQVSDRMSFLNNMLDFFTRLVKTVNYILLVTLGALSIVSLAITGVRYITAMNNPTRLQDARNNLHTVFIGMFIGFGAFIIWNVAMGIIQLILSTVV